MAVSALARTGAADIMPAMGVHTALLCCLTAAERAAALRKAPHLHGIAECIPGGRPDVRLHAKSTGPVKLCPSCPVQAEKLRHGAATVCRTSALPALHLDYGSLRESHHRAGGLMIHMCAASSSAGSPSTSGRQAQSAAGHAHADLPAAWLQVVPGAISQAALHEHPDMPWTQWCAPSQQQAMPASHTLQRLRKLRFAGCLGYARAQCSAVV